MTDEHLLTAAKLYEQARGRIEGSPLHPHDGLPTTSEVTSRRTFLEDAFLEAAPDRGMQPSFAATKLGSLVDSHYRSQAARTAIESDDITTLSYLVGVTEQDLDASAITLPFRIADRIDNNDAPAFISAAGNPNTGKTNTMFLLVQIAKELYDDPLVITNVKQADITDVLATDAHSLALSILENRHRDLIVVLDEGSTHFDARTKSYEVADQWTPLAKRMAKLNVRLCGIVVHTGKDLHPEAKRLTTTAFYKSEKTEVQFYADWPAEDDRPSDPLFGGDLTSLESTSEWYDPDDAAPWDWNLDSDLFSRGLSWPALEEHLRSTQN